MQMKQQEFKLSRAVESPLRTIVENADLEGSVVVAS
jgi:chaperonin GroEL (HSP60 family)